MPGNEIVTRTPGDGYRTEIDAGGFRMVADEPAGVGGTGAGPTPYDLLLAALGSCTGMTLRMYASRKGWPLEDVTVTLREARDHAADCVNCDQPDARITRLDREIVVGGPLDETQRDRLLHISNQCPVHKSLAGAFHIRTTLLGSHSGTEAPS
ncbi:MAG: Bll2902 protein [uncultured Gemmatimonadetes bacterium]|uniref:Bll2902 protein n=1 Tax=uncultured Gemmatimonadota bacterium TaxID=203437 RepID=A0A6J4L9W6_9BACT|nr:MAG: Bll2902 protein [uncultured Gemmatimonadota bacterium]